MNKTILVADDSRTVQTSVNLTFRTTDFSVVPVTDGDEAFARISEVKPDLVLADVVMPGRDGYELCAAIKKDANTARIPVLLLTGRSAPIDEARAQQSGADGHIQKPFDTKVLIERALELTGADRGDSAPESFADSLAARQGSTSQDSAADQTLAAPAPVLSPGPREEEVFFQPSSVPSAGSDTPSLSGGPALSPIAKSVANSAAAPIAAAAATVGAGDLPREELVRVAREVIEQIAWEVVPELAENIIRSELARLLEE